MPGQQLHGSRAGKGDGALRGTSDSCFVSDLLAFVFFHFLFLRLN